MEDTYSYKGWLCSDSLLKRAFAVLGHYSIAQLILVVAIMIPAFIFGFLFGLLKGLFAY